jgi:hypothetical protein
MHAVTSSDRNPLNGRKVLVGALASFLATAAISIVFGFSQVGDEVSMSVIVTALVFTVGIGAFLLRSRESRSTGVGVIVGVVATLIFLVVAASILASSIDG